MPNNWFDFLGIRVEPEEAEFILLTDDYLNTNVEHPCKIALLIEPPAIRPHAYDYIKSHYSEFNHILTHNEELLNTLPNAKLCFFGGGWIHPNLWKIYSKTENTSIVVSHKSTTEGHRLRHQVLSKNWPIKNFGYMNPVDRNFLALRDFRFNIAIENSQVDLYFTEKILDCFSTGTIPIYWGCPSINTYFDKEGIITFNSIEELEQIIPTLTPELYESKLIHIKNNLWAHKLYWSYEQNIESALAKCL